MVGSDQELLGMLERFEEFQEQAAILLKSETTQANCQASGESRK